MRCIGLQINRQMTPLLDDRPIFKVVAIAELGRIATAHLIQKRLGNVEYILVEPGSSPQPAVHHFSASGRRLSLGSEAQPFAEKMRTALQGADMVFIVGDGPDEVEAQTVARIASSLGVLTAGVFPHPSTIPATTPPSKGDVPVDAVFWINMHQQADFFEPLKASREAKDALTLPIQFLAEFCGRHMDKEGHVLDIDFEDLLPMLTSSGFCTLGLGEAAGSDRAQLAAESAVALSELDLSNAKGAVVLIKASPQSLKLAETSSIMKVTSAHIANDGPLLLQTIYDASLKDRIQVSVLATFGWGYNG